MTELLPAGFEAQWQALKSAGFDLPASPQTFKSKARAKSGAPVLKFEFEIESKYRVDDALRLKLIREGMINTGKFVFVAAGKEVAVKILDAGVRVAEDTYMVDHAAALSTAQLAFRVRKEQRGDTMTTCKLPPLVFTVAGTHARMEIEVREPDGMDRDAVDVHRTAQTALRRLVASYIADSVDTLEPKIRIHTERHDFLVVTPDDTRKLALISTDHVRCEDLKGGRAAEFFELEVEADDSQDFGEKVATSGGIGAVIRDRWDLTALLQSKVERATGILRERRS